jgi:hypothetical protein
LLTSAERQPLPRIVLGRSSLSSASLPKLEFSLSLLGLKPQQPPGQLDREFACIDLAKRDAASS